MEEGERGSVVTELGLMRGEENPPKWGNKIREREMGKIRQIRGQNIKGKKEVSK